ncbi:hypothetical protein [Tunicatimonas pelagia]|uniref:putative polyvalent protein kinase domain-containing protein n=1 Tax=Tunicatimonas pelagia TaxID=931531 RepID=UPI0026660362|nr:hypothetical protein [Tunicatimonas pelagia]WKN46302.1 hypothetical protein P0M28_15240 [Tunicatimonas pelagia]
MNLKSTKYELQTILSGKSGYSYDALIQTVARYLRTGQRASPMAEEKHQSKGQETEKLINFAKENNLFYNDIEEDQYISEGAEQKVYIKNEQYVLKLNDAIYYASWEDYFFNLILHNYFFADTAYQLLGLYENKKVLYAVVKQPFIRADRLTDLAQVKAFLANNGFENTRSHDYYHPQLGIVLEDLHDENVLTQQETLYFIDTVFYIDSEVFWN